MGRRFSTSLRLVSSRKSNWPWRLFLRYPAEMIVDGARAFPGGFRTIIFRIDHWRVRLAQSTNRLGSKPSVLFTTNPAAYSSKYSRNTERFAKRYRRSIGKSHSDHGRPNVNLRFTYGDRYRGTYDSSVLTFIKSDYLGWHRNRPITATIRRNNISR